MELFSFLDPLREAGFSVDFVSRVEGVMGCYDKEEGLLELEPYHREAVRRLNYEWEVLWRAEQVHGAEVELVGGESFLNFPNRIVSGADGLMTADSSLLLGIYVADCGLIWVADRKTKAVALLHSGRKGTEAGILPRAVAAMREKFGTRAEDLMVVLGPCVRPPIYEVDIAELIREQAQNAGVGEFIDCGICTGREVDRFYSYRVEKGCTGRMLGLLGSSGSEAAL